MTGCPFGLGECNKAIATGGTAITCGMDFVGAFECRIYFEKKYSYLGPYVYPYGIINIPYQQPSWDSTLHFKVKIVNGVWTLVQEL